MLAANARVGVVIGGMVGLSELKAEDDRRKPNTVNQTFARPLADPQLRSMESKYVDLL